MHDYSVISEGDSFAVMRTLPGVHTEIVGRWNMRHQADEVCAVLNKWRGCEQPATADAVATAPRKLSAIAADIADHWEKPNYAARPYLLAMSQMNTISDSYGADSADSIVRYFLANASTWRGEDARRIKAELRSMLGYK